MQSDLHHHSECTGENVSEGGAIRYDLLAETGGVQGATAAVGDIDGRGGGDMNLLNGVDGQKRRRKGEKKRKWHRQRLRHRVGAAAGP